MKKNVFLRQLTLCLLCTLPTAAALPNLSDQSPQEVKDKIQAQKVAYFTHQMSLSPEEAQVFWALYNGYEQDRMQLHREMRSAHSHKGEKVKFEELSDKEAQELLGKKVKLMNLERKFHTDLLRIFSPQRVLLFYDTERSFHRRLIHMEMKVNNKSGKHQTIQITIPDKDKSEPANE